MINIIGIDEVGRGPVAGPVTVCAVIWLSKKEIGKVFENIKDSKKLTQKGREEWFNFAKNVKEIKYFVSSVEPKEIDSAGITAALLKASNNVLKNFKTIAHVYSDYGLPINEKYKHTHIIKGDEKIPLISLASIIAKVTRDKEMIKYSKKYPKYMFHKNKGYGTREHIKVIQKYGICEIHRKSFLKRYINNIEQNK